MRGWRLWIAAVSAAAALSVPAGASAEIPETVEPVFVCPPGATYNPASRMCEAPPQCPPPGTYNPKTKRCEARPTPVPSGGAISRCPEGQYLDLAENRCKPTVGLSEEPSASAGSGADPYCPPPGTYNPKTKMCEAAIQSAPVPDGGR